MWEAALVSSVNQIQVRVSMARKAGMKAHALAAMMYVLLPLFVFSWRDENEVGYQSARHSRAKTSLHIRMDGIQTKLKPLSLVSLYDPTASPPGAAAGAPAGTSGATPVEATPYDDTDHSHIQVKKNRSFWESLDPRGSPMMVMFWVVIVAALGIPLVTFFRGSATAIETPEMKKGAGVDAGTVLICTCRDTEALAKVYAEMGSSDFLHDIEFAETVTAAGPAKLVNGLTMVPIEPKGAVRLMEFKDHKALLIQSGSILTCKRPEGADIFREVHSDYVLGAIEAGEKVVASGPSQWHQGWMMVPIRPRGAVEIELFDVNVGELPTDETAISAWARAELEGDAETTEKLKKLRSEKARVMMEQALRTKKMEQIIEEILEHEAELSGKAKPTDEEIKRSAHKAIANADLAAKRNMFMAMAYAAPILTQSAKIYSTVENTVQKTRAKATAMVMEESKATLKQLQSVFGFEGLDELDCNHVNIPAIAAVLACVFAPTQLRLVYMVNFVFLALSVVNVLMDLGVLTLDFHTPCMDIAVVPEPPGGAGFLAWARWWWLSTLNNRVYMWFLVDFGVHMFCLAARIPLLRRVGRMISNVAPPPNMETEPDPIKALKIY